jgi:lipid A disaccharide synthetase
LRHDHLFESASELDDITEYSTLATDQLSLNRPVLLITTGVRGHIYRWIAKTITALKELNRKNAHIAVKLHWNHFGDQIAESAFEDFQWSQYSIHSTKLYELIRNADVLLMGFSTTAIESTILKTPVINLRPRILSDQVNDYIRKNLALPAGSIDETKLAIQRALNPEFRNSWLDERNQILETFLQNSKITAIESLLRQIKESVFTH